MIWVTYARFEDSHGNQLIVQPKAGDAWTVDQLVEMVRRFDAGTDQASEEEEQ